MPDDRAPSDPLFIRRQFLDERLRRSILAACDPSAESAGAIYRGTGTIVDEDYRRCRVVELSAEIEREIAARFEALKPELEAGFGVQLEGFQQPRLMRYRKGDFFVPHQDSDAKGPAWLRDRKLTAVVFVNGQEGSGTDGDYRGGTLTLYCVNDETAGDEARTRVPGERGLLVVFRASLFHEVSRVTRGERYSIVSWFY